MSGNLPFRRAALAATVLACLCHPPAAVGQQSGAPNPHAGLWSLEFRVATRPGGEVRVASRGITPEDVQTVNLLVHIQGPSFTVAASGVVRWEQRGGGSVHWDDFSRLVGKTATSDTQPVLRVVGRATAVPAAAGSGRTYDRRLTLGLDWAGGTGMTLDHMGKPWTTQLSADGSQVITAYGAAAVVYERSSWELEPTSVQREEIATDVIRETTIYRASRQRATNTYKFGVPLAPFPITERIEIKHVHYPKLVPRG